MKRILSIIICTLFFVVVSAQSQSYSVKTDSIHRAKEIREITDGLNKADLVVEGRAIKWKGIWNKTYTQVFTSYTVVVYKLFKGNINSDTIEIVCRGGRLAKGDTMSDITSGMVISHNDPLGSNEEGIFFLHYNDWNAQLMDAPNSFVLWHDYRITYGYPYAGKVVNPKASSRNYMYQNIPEVYNLLAKIQHKPYKVILENPNDKDVFKSKK